MDELLTQQQEFKNVNRKKQLCLVFRHDKFPNIELYCVKCWAVVTEEGPTPFPEEDEGRMCDDQYKKEENDTEKDGREIPADVRLGSQENIDMMMAEGFDVDDDNQPAPENVPDTNDTLENNDGLYPGQKWIDVNICERKSRCGDNWSPRFYAGNIYELSIFALFKFFPVDWLLNILLVETN